MTAAAPAEEVDTCVKQGKTHADEDVFWHSKEKETASWKAKCGVVNLDVGVVKSGMETMLATGEDEININDGGQGQAWDQSGANGGVLPHRDGKRIMIGHSPYGASSYWIMEPRWHPVFQCSQHVVFSPVVDESHGIHSVPLHLMS